MVKRVAPPSNAEAPVSEGRYRIATVASLTGVPEPTLRAWERRYGVPEPARTDSGYRLYGEEDIALVREMRRLCAEGLAAAEAAKLLRDRSTTGGPFEATAALDGAKDAYDLASDAILGAVEAFDDVALDRALRRLLFVGSATVIVDRVIAPLLRTIGDRWHAGELSVAQEHLATQAMGTMLRALLRLMTGPEARVPALLACFADEEHELGLLAFALRLPELGLRPVFLGARTPPEALKSAIDAGEPKIVALSVTVAPEKARAKELVRAYAAACGDLPWLVGGAGVEAIAKEVEKRGGAAVIGDEASLAPDVRAILQRAASRGRVDR